MILVDLFLFWTVSQQSTEGTERKTESQSTLWVRFFFTPPALQWKIYLTLQDDLFASLLQGLHSLIMCGLPQVITIDRHYGVPNIKRLRLVSSQALKNLGDEDRHLVLLPTCWRRSKTLRQRLFTTFSEIKARCAFTYRLAPCRLKPFFKHLGIMLFCNYTIGVSDKRYNKGLQRPEPQPPLSAACSWT